MNYKIVQIEFENGYIKKYPISDFDFYGKTNELEHKRENIIINLSDYSRSFCYELDDNYEIDNKTPIKISFK
ncbi:MAG: hypothetical protein MJ211_09135 [Bacteroidales bacterium]|nr:hypothetical protein [Bacteroidales bacterium]